MKNTLLKTLGLSLAITCMVTSLSLEAAQLVFRNKEGKSITNGVNEKVKYVSAFKYNDNGVEMMSISIADSVGRHCQILQKNLPGVDFVAIALNLLKSSATVWCNTNLSEVPATNASVMTDSLEISDRF